MKSKSPTLELMKAEARPGCCAACDSPIPPRTGGGAKVLCGHPECKRTWREVYRADVLDRRRAATAARRALFSIPRARPWGEFRWRSVRRGALAA